MTSSLAVFEAAIG